MKELIVIVVVVIMFILLTKENFMLWRVDLEAQNPIKDYWNINDVNNTTGYTEYDRKLERDIFSDSGNPLAAKYYASEAEKPLIQARDIRFIPYDMNSLQEKIYTQLDL